ncbi:bifunctional riboflavin kinase/FAD synthetase [Phenylobacterium sp. LjRoot225]|uniref:bifunctional riboflavin kinase/FAD synthetase n=1 Tax=Phenylobacterium sp. LjRoot225 TaxID=3342285 RepID=UPI003ECCC836
MRRLRVVRGWKDLPASDRGAAIAVGSFDGVHRGHQRVIDLAAEAAKALGAPLAVITFDPHPRAYFHPDQPAFALQKRDQQARALETLGVEVLYVLPLEPELAEMSDREFASRVLAQGLGARHIAVGFDNTFGKDRSGSPDAMQAYGQELGFGVSVAPAVTGGEGDKFSSTRIREALREGRPQEAAEILGRPFAIEGAVQRGRQLGRKLGFPTANVSIAGYVVPRFGVYATRTRLPDGRQLPGVANIGVNPTIEGHTDPVLEVWLFDFDEDLYDQVIETELIAFLRPEEKFPDLPTMVTQVLADAQAARTLLGA